MSKKLLSYVFALFATLSLSAYAHYCGSHSQKQTCENADHKKHCVWDDASSQSKKCRCRGNPLKDDKCYKTSDATKNPAGTFDCGVVANQNCGVDDSKNYCKKDDKDKSKCVCKNDGKKNHSCSK